MEFETESPGPGTAAAVRALTLNDKLIRGLGGFFSIRGLIAVPVCLIIIGGSIDEFEFAFHDAPIVVTKPADFQSVEQNDFVQSDLKLDYESALHVQRLTGDEYVVYPFVGLESQFFYYKRGPVLLKNGKPVEIQAKKGMAVGPDFSNEWMLEHNRCELVESFQEIGLAVQDDAIVLVPREPGWPSPWVLFVSFVSLCILTVFLFRVSRAVRMLTSVDYLTNYVEKLQTES